MLHSNPGTRFKTSARERAPMSRISASVTTLTTPGAVRALSENLDTVTTDGISEKRTSSMLSSARRGQAKSERAADALKIEAEPLRALALMCAFDMDALPSLESLER